MLLIYIIAMFIYMVPGLFVARNEYAKQVRAHGKAEPRVILPKKPDRPRIKIKEVLHDRSCHIIRNSGKTCSCSNRNEWINVRNSWLDYDEWIHKYEHLEEKANTIKAAKVPLTAVPFWPVYFAKSFIEKGAVGIPDYKATLEADRLLEQFQEEDNKKLEGK